MRILVRTRRRRFLGAAIAVTLAVASALWGFGPSPAGAATTTPTWSSVSPASSPPPLAYASMAYDSDNGTIVLFGGQAANGSLSSTTWIWNGSSWAHTASAVPARARASMAFDPKLHQLILFGGIGADGQPLADTWAWNGASWYPETSSSSPTPPARQGATLALDASGQLVLFGGTGVLASSSATPADPTATSTPSSSGPLADTWTWTGSAWSEQNGGSPPARTAAAMAWDAATSQSVLFGGSSNPAAATAPSGLLGDTWSWGPSGWSLTTAPASPPPMADLVLVDDPDLGGLVSFGGATGTGPTAASWRWDGASWSPLSAAGAPAAREGAAGAYDVAAHQLVVFGGVGAGGQVLGDTEILTAQAPSTATSSPATATSTTTTPPARHASPPAVIRPATTVPTAHPAPTTSTTAPTSTGGGSSPAPAATVSLHPGALMTLHGSGFAPGSPVTITFHSTPLLVGRTMAGVDGTFVATVAVPTTAVAGLHHFDAQGRTSAGTPLLLVTPVRVVLQAARHHTTLQTLAMIAIAVALPAGCWLLMEVRSRRRRPVVA